MAETLERAAEAVRRAGLQPAGARRRGLLEASRLVDGVRPLLADSDAPAVLLRELHATTQRIGEAMQVRLCARCCSDCAHIAGRSAHISDDAAHQRGDAGGAVWAACRAVQ